jgi:hypothetical protein
LADWFTSGRIVDLILLLIVLEWLALVLLRRAGRPAPDGVLPYLASGAALLLALRAALAGAEWHWIALALLAAFITHLADLYQRWPRRRAGPGV